MAACAKPGNRKCRPLAFVLTEGHAADSPQFIPLLRKVRVRGPVGRPRTRPDAVAGDKVYSSCGNRAHLRKRHIKAVIPEKRDQAANRNEHAAQGVAPEAAVSRLTRPKPVRHKRSPCRAPHDMSEVSKARPRHRCWSRRRRPPHRGRTACAVAAARL
ncbi:transposase [Streptomyces griseoluteus]